MKVLWKTDDSLAIAPKWPLDNNGRVLVLLVRVSLHYVSRKRHYGWAWRHVHIMAKRWSTYIMATICFLTTLRQIASPSESRCSLEDNSAWTLSLSFGDSDVASVKHKWTLSGRLPGWWDLQWNASLLMHVEAIDNTFMLFIAPSLFDEIDCSCSSCELWILVSFRISLSSENIFQISWNRMRYLCFNAEFSVGCKRRVSVLSSLLQLRFQHTV